MPSDSRAHVGDRRHDHSILHDRFHWYRHVAISLESPSPLLLESSHDLALLILFPSLLPMTSPPPCHPPISLPSFSGGSFTVSSVVSFSVVLLVAQSNSL